VLDILIITHTHTQTHTQTLISTHTRTHTHTHTQRLPVVASCAMWAATFCALGAVSFAQAVLQEYRIYTYIFIYIYSYVYVYIYIYIYSRRQIQFQKGYCVSAPLTMKKSSGFTCASYSTGWWGTLSFWGLGVWSFGTIHLIFSCNICVWVCMCVCVCVCVYI